MCYNMLQKNIRKQHNFMIFTEYIIYTYTHTQTRTYLPSYCSTFFACWSRQSTESEKEFKNSSSWEITTTVFSVAIIKSVKCSIPFVSRLFVGSSNNRISASNIRAVCVCVCVCVCVSVNVCVCVFRVENVRKSSNEK